jgi:hypothetical protein
MNLHRWELLRAWALLTERGRFNPVTERESLTREERVRVKRFLQGQVKMARRELGAIEEVELGRKWAQLLEQRADESLMDTLALSIREEDGESPAEFKVRLADIAEQLRCRLSTVRAPAVPDEGALSAAAQGLPLARARSTVGRRTSAERPPKRGHLSDKQRPTKTERTSRTLRREVVAAAREARAQVRAEGEVPAGALLEPWWVER